MGHIMGAPLSYFLFWHRNRPPVGADWPAWPRRPPSHHLLAQPARNSAPQPALHLGSSLASTTAPACAAAGQSAPHTAGGRCRASPIEITKKAADRWGSGRRLSLRWRAMTRGGRHGHHQDNRRLVTGPCHGSQPGDFCETPKFCKRTLDKQNQRDTVCETYL
jgi:hypothetical protein